MIKKKKYNQQQTNQHHHGFCLVRPICFYLAKSIYAAILPFGLDRRFPLPPKKRFLSGPGLARRVPAEAVRGWPPRRRRGRRCPPRRAAAPAAASARASAALRLRRGGRQRRLAGGSPNETSQGRQDKGEKPPLPSWGAELLGTRSPRGSPRSVPRSGLRFRRAVKFIINWKEGEPETVEGEGRYFCVSLGSLGARNVPARRLNPSHRSGLDQGTRTSQIKQER